MVEHTDMIATPGTSTRIGDIESQLNHLWSQIAESEGQNAILRATTLTLVLYTNDPQAAPALISQISEAHPCRAIVIDVDDAAPDVLTAEPTVFCRPSLGSGSQRTQVCCEEILITAGRDAVNRVSGAVQALLLPDLPVFLFHQGGVSAADPILNGLIHAIDGLIVDSASFEDIPASLRGLVGLRDMPHFHADPFDLNWHRLLPWRTALAQMFDGTSERLLLKSIQSVEITHNKARAQALLYFGWLISRLGWQLIAGGDANTWLAQSAQGDILLHLDSNEADTPGLRSVTLTTDQNPISISMSDDCSCLITTDGREMTTHLSPMTVGTCISMILDAPHRDHVFDESLSTAVSLATDMHVLSQRAGVIVANNTSSLARLAARSFVQAARHAIEKRGRFTVALSGGSTPKAMYELLARKPLRDRIEWLKVHFFWGDERNVPVGDEDSNQRMAHEALLNNVPILPGNVHGVLTGQLSAEEAAAQYAADIRTFFNLKAGELPEFDLILLGLGDDGHTASLFPRTAALNAEASQIFVANPVPRLNTTRLTLTAGVINNAASVIFLVSGKTKADILYTVFKGPLQPDDFPAQRIRPEDGSLTVITDQDAAAKLHD